jgi:hypothetical protein
MRLLLALLLLSGCATSRVQEYRDAVDEAHTKALISAEAPTVFAQFQKERDGIEAVVCKGVKGKECDAKTWPVYTTRLQERYYLADFASLQQYCAGHPVECDSADAFEAVAKRSHNAGIEASRQRKHHELDEAQSQEDAQRAAALYNAGQAMRGLSNQLSPPGTRCLTSPGPMGTYNTVCK